MLTVPLYFYFFHHGGGGDTTAPTLVSATINSAGTGLTLVFSEAVTGVSAANFALSSGALSAAAGSNTTWTMTVAPAVTQGATITLSYSGTAVKDLALNSLLAFSGFSITNNSTVPGFGAVVAPVLSFAYATNTAIRLTWTNATGGDGVYTYAVKRDGVAHASGVTSPYDDSTGLATETVYAYTVVVTDGQSSTATSNSVNGALPSDGTGTGESGGVVDVSDGDRLNLVRGDDHTEGDRLPSWTFTDYAGPSMVGGTCVLRLLRVDLYSRIHGHDRADLEVVAAMTQTGSTIIITAPITSAESIDLFSTATDDETTHEYQLIGTTSAGKPHTIKFGPTTVLRSILAHV